VPANNWHPAKWIVVLQFTVLRRRVSTHLLERASYHCSWGASWASNAVGIVVAFTRTRHGFPVARGPRGTELGGRGRIGECLLELGFVTELQVTAALGAQWACPVFPGQRVNSSTCDGMLPLPLLENFRMLPVQFVAATRILYIAFGAEVNYGVLYAIERMLGCRTEACVISDRCLRDALECLAQERRTGDRLFEGWGDAREMARLTSGYALKFAAPTVRIMGCGEYIWVRLESGSDFANLLFRQSAPSAKVQQLLRA
jgi:Type II secretion system (T2SS), protein E, N-terminal domain